MKTIITLLILAGLTFNLHSQWTVQQFYPDYKAAYFLNNGASPTGYAAGENGIIRKTTNRGLTWINQYTGTTEEINAIRFGDLADTLKGYAVGNAGLILKTTNGGINWIQQPYQSYHIFDVAVGRGDTAIAGSIGGRLHRTFDGGLDWSTQMLGGGTANILGVYRYSFSVFYACDASGRVYISSNAGVTWTQYSTSTSTALYSITTIGGTFLSCGLTGVLTRSTNSGVNWVSATSGTTALLNEVFAVPAGNFLIATSDGSILRSTNAGLNFFVAAPPANISLNEIELSSVFGEILAFGDEGLIRHSSDYGTTWSYRSFSLGGDITSISFTSPLIGFACATEGELFKTTDGGANWTSSFLSTYGLTSIDFANSSTGYISGEILPNLESGNDCRIFRTTNGGLNWLSFHVIDNRELYSVDFADAATGWCLSSNAVMNDGAVTELFKTTNSGVNWTNVFNFNVNVNDIYFINSATGWAAASGGNLARTTNGGLNWQQVGTPTSADYCSITFINQNQGYACGTGGVIIATTNSGQNWVQQTSGVNIKLNSIHFGSALNGICVGENGTRLRTINGGQAWINNREEANMELFSCFMPTSINAYAGGYMGYIANFGGIVTEIEPVSNIIPSEFKLEQNYPNPFNPKTIIKFQITELSDSKLIVYDILGKEVATLLNENLQPGSYEISFEGIALPSGVYFYRLETEKFAETKKMILIK